MNERDARIETLSPLKRALLALAETQARVEELERSRSEPIAIIGLGCRFPGGVRGPASYWQLLRTGGDAITPVPADRWDMAAWFDPDPAVPGKMSTRWGGFLPDIDQFDPRFFGIAPREAISMDPQQRLLLEVAWEALENAGIPPDCLDGSATGVFLGLYNNNYTRLGMGSGDPLHIDAYSASGAASSVAAGRLSYSLGLHGPSLAIDTACSSSLVAVHLACQSLRHGECDLALAGGVNLILAPQALIASSKLRVIAPDGRCKTFDAAADGFAQAEGCGLIVLKRLSAARADGDPILALVRGTAVNQDGRSSGLTAPNGLAQEAVIRQALARADVAPAQVQFVEAHGTGTALGDPIEVQALAAALGPGRSPDRPLLIGSVKTNLGHTEAAAGVAGLIKVVLALLHREVPPNLHFVRPNPLIDFHDMPVQVPTRLLPWPSEGGPRLAGVSAFGFGGTNAHAVLAEAPDSERRTEPPRHPLHLLCLSARDEAALWELANRYARWLREEALVAFADVCAAAYLGRVHFKERLAVIATDSSQAADLLTGWRANPDRLLIDGSSPVPAEWRSRLEELGRAYLRNGRIDWAKIDPPLTRPRVWLPNYPFQRQRYWLEPGKTSVASRDPDLVRTPEAGTEKDKLVGSPAIVEYYDSLAVVAPNGAAAPGEGHLTFGLFSEPVPGFSWLLAFFFPGQFPEQHRKLVDAQKALKDLLYRNVEFSAVRHVLDFGCGHAADLVELGQQHPHLRLDGCTVSARQVEVGLRRVQALGLQDRIRLHHRDSSKDAFPGQYDLVLGFEVAGNISDKNGLFANVASHLNNGGLLLLADFVARSEPIANPTTSGYTSTAEQWADLLADHQLRLLQCQDVSQAIAFFLHDDRWDEHLARVVEEFRFEETTVRHLRSQENIRKALEKGWMSYVLLVGQKDGCSPREPIRAWNRQCLHAARPGEVAPSTRKPIAGSEAVPDDWFRTVAWHPRPLERPTSVAAALTSPAQLSALLEPLVPVLRVRHELDRYRSLGPELDRLSAEYVLKACHDLGWHPAAGQRIVTPSLASQLGVMSRYQRLLGRLLEILAEDGFLRRQAGEWEVVRSLSPAEPREHAERLLACYPGCTAELTLLGRCGPRLADVLRGTCDPLALLFPDGSLQGTETLYQDSPFACVANTLIQHALAAVLQALPRERRLRILEIGAGTGGTTTYLLPILAGRVAEYLFTDVSPHFLAQARRKFEAYPFVRFEPYDANCAPAGREFAPQSFDVVLASNVLHVTADLRQALRRARGLLAPGGLLILMESTGRLRWGDLVFGLTEGWWQFADIDLRPDYPLLAQEQWLQVLADTGFTEPVAVREGEPDRGGVSQQAVILAHNPIEPGPRNRWLILADGQGVGLELSRKLEARGDQTVLVFPGPQLEEPGPNQWNIRPREPLDFQRCIAQVREGGSLQGVIHLWALDATTPEQTTSASLTRDTMHVCGSALHLMQALTRAPGSGLTPTWMITHRAQACDQRGVRVSAVQATLWGLAKGVVREHPDWSCVRIDLDTVATRDAADLLLQELATPTGEDQIAYRAGQRYVARLVGLERGPASSSVELHTEAAYLITGGLGGLGLATARWLVRKGARHLALAGRRPPAGPARGAIEEMRQAGVQVLVISADVSGSAEVARMLSMIRTELPPLRGIIHAAGVLDDGVLLQQDWSRFAPVLAPKVEGAWNLHEQTRRLSLDWFVLYSSSASLLGSPGQCNHAAANAFLDSLAFDRRAEGLPAVTINWGAWSEVGAVADRADLEHIGRWGMGKMTPAQGVAALEWVLSRNAATQVGILPMDWSLYLRQFLAGREPRFLEELKGPASRRPEAEMNPTPADEFLRQWREAPAGERRDLLLRRIQEEAAHVLGLDPGQYPDPRIPLQELGLDSLMAVEMRNLLGQVVGTSLPATLLFDQPSCRQLTDFLAQEVLPKDPSPRRATDTRAPSEVELDGLSSDELLGLLDQQLAAAKRRLPE